MISGLPLDPLTLLATALLPRRGRASAKTGKQPKCYGNGRNSGAGSVTAGAVSFGVGFGVGFG